MDRLPILITLLVLVSGCKDKPGDGAAPVGRVDAVKPDHGKRRTSADFCDVQPAPEKAPSFALPALAGAATPPAQDGWRWVNVWATWCKPCVEELPLLGRWHDQLA